MLKWLSIIFLAIGILLIGIAMWFFFSKNIRTAFTDVRVHKVEKPASRPAITIKTIKKQEFVEESPSFTEEEHSEERDETAFMDEEETGYMDEEDKTGYLSEEDDKTGYLGDESLDAVLDETEFLESELDETDYLESHDETEFLDEDDETSFLAIEDD